MSVVHWTGIDATARRQLISFLGNPLGYVFILGFVLIAGAVLFWLESGGSSYFARNIADLGPWLRDDAFGWLLAVLLPALAMGAWAAERDHGTEEHLLTLPLSPLDALLGKWLAIAAFFTLALLCTLSHVGVVAWLGDPDWGAVFANYLGWWLAGLAFAAIALFASTLVSLPAIAFVIGVVGCAIAQWAFHVFGYYDGFARGVVSIGAVASALAVAAGALGAATFVLSSRRWRPGSHAVVVTQVASLVFALVLVANLARLGGRAGLDVDTTVEGLSSVSPASVQALRALQAPVTITAFISRDLPPELALKGKEVIDKLKAIERAAPSMIRLDIRYPSDALDDDGAWAQTEFNLKPRRQIVDSASGRRMADVFLGAAVSSAGRTQVIEHFDPGLSVEYELVRAIRSVSQTQKRVLGIATTDLEIMGGFDYRTMSMTPSWDIVEEWKRQYEVRSVSLDSEVSPEIEALVVPQPSTLTQAQIERLHDYIWNGRPALLLEDPFPFFQVLQGRGDLIPSQPKRNPARGMFAAANEETTPKGDLRPLLRALGIDFRPDETYWSDYNPSHYFRDLIPPNFVWLTQGRDAIRGNEVTTGVNALLLPFPGGLFSVADQPSGLSVAPLLLPAQGSPWGMNTIMDLIQHSWQGQVQLRRQDEVKRRAYPDQQKRPPLAVLITGTMPSAYPRLPPGTKAEEGKEPPKPQSGTPSPKPVRVIIIADIDLVDNEFFRFYRDQGNQLGKQDELRPLMDLKNIQLVANAVDALFNDTSYLALRTRRPQARPLTRLEAVATAAREARRLQLEAITTDLQAKIDKINDDFQASLRKIEERTDLDEETKAHEKSRAEIVGQRRIQREINELKLKMEQEERRLEIQQARAVEAYHWRVKFLAVVIPSAILALVAVVVFVNRLIAEKTQIPASRRRQS
ncbi:MAG: Gldg family protein [Planctomycetota bacterium]|nr:Gldg family protein [Planctomycetota bacterium]MCX8040376.1 Gldg family protein [Planctomycetota bacterium]MDW8373752.1 Gldg family protein [Planctomycetota bacterium]